MKMNKLTKIELIRELESLQSLLTETQANELKLQQLVDKYLDIIYHFCNTNISDLALNGFDNHEELGFELAKELWKDLAKNGTITLDYNQKRKELYNKGE